MIIGIDGRYVEGDLVGIGKYIKYLVLGLTKRNIKVIIFYSKRPMHSFSNKLIQEVVLNSSNRYVFEQYLLPNAFKKYKIDLYHATGNLGIPLFSRVPAVLTVHDLIPLDEKNYFRHSSFPLLSKTSYFLRLFTSCFKAKKIIAVSKYAGYRLNSLFEITKKKTQVIYSGVNLVTPDKNLPFDLKEKEYILNHGGMGERKNLTRLILAFSKVSLKFPMIKLVITGADKNLKTKLEKIVRLKKLQFSVIFTGYVSEGALSRLVKSAFLICYPSLLEGFGFPILEGFASGVPVITSKNSAMEEVSGGAALLVNPKNTAQLTESMKRLIENRVLREELIKKGLEVVKKFDWEKTIDQTIKSYREIM